MACRNDASNLTRRALMSSVMSSVAAGVCFGQRFARAPARPNVVVVLTDDQGYGDISCHGNPVLRTPAIDRLHARSVRFTDFHAAPMCTPARGQLLTGLDAAHNLATATDTGRALLRRDVPTMADIFRASGYATGIFGKWHLGDAWPYRPMERGFETARYHQGGAIGAPPDLGTDYYDGYYRDNGIRRQFTGYCTDFWFSEAMHWMEERAKVRQPFFCYLPLNAPHSPLWVDEKYAAPYRKPGLPAEYFGMVANIDENLGRLTAFLDERGLAPNTILIFLTDNGAASAPRIFNAGMRGQKMDLYDGGHRVPCFIHWAGGGISGPRDIDTPAQFQDLLPTFIDLCGLESPSGAKFDGVSLAGLLRSTSDAPGALNSRTLVVQYGRTLEKWDSALIHGPYRYVRGAELYNIRTDPGQKTDISAQNAELVRKLRDYYERWWDALGSDRTRYLPVHIGARAENPVTLSCVDWRECGCRNSSTREVISLNQGGPRGGPWGVHVESDGLYEIALRRWPAHMNLPLSASVPEQRMKFGVLKPGKALPIASARLQIAGRDLHAAAAKPAAKPEDTAIRFRVELRQGSDIPLHGWFQDAQGQDVCGAYFADVRRT